MRVFGKARAHENVEHVVHVFLGIFHTPFRQSADQVGVAAVVIVLAPKDLRFEGESLGSQNTCWGLSQICGNLPNL